MDDRARYDAAFDAMLKGDVVDAAAGFATVAQTAQDPQLRTQAAELGRLAHELALRHARMTFDAPPAPATGAAGGGLSVAGEGGGVSEDDTPTGGRASFVVTTTLGALYTGVVAIDLLDINDTRTGVLLVMGTTAGGVIGSLYGTQGRRMTAGMANAWFIGQWAGAGNALLLSSPLGLYDGTNTDKKVLSFTLGASWGAATAGLLIADRYQPTAAQTNITGTFGVMGIASTLGALAIIQPSNLGSKTFLTLMAVGLDGGIGAGTMFANRLDWSKSRVLYVDLAAFLGVVAGGGTSLLIFADGKSSGDTTARVSAAITLAGMWGGFALGAHLTRDMAPDYRFRTQTPTQPTATISPTILHDNTSAHSGANMPGVALVGQF